MYKFSVKYTNSKIRSMQKDKNECHFGGKFETFLDERGLKWLNYLCKNICRFGGESKIFWMKEGRIIFATNCGTLYYHVK